MVRRRSLTELSKSFRLCIAVTVSLVLLTWAGVSPAISHAETIQIFATVPVSPHHFQLELSGPPTEQPYSQGRVLEYSLTYGSLLTTTTDLIVLEVTWSRGTIVGQDGQQVDILQYIDGSATTAINGVTASYDPLGRKLVWQINPMLPVKDQVVTWQLLTLANYTGSSPVAFSISAKLVGQGFTKPTPQLEYEYLYDPDTPPTDPVITPAPTQPEPGVDTPPSAPGDEQPAPNLLTPIINRIGEVPVIGPPIKEIIEKSGQIAQRGGGAAAAPIAIAISLWPLLSSIFSLLSSAPWWQIPSLLSALFWAGRRRPWGVVYDSASKEPLDPVILTLTDHDGKQHQTISDIYGRYQFLVEPGRYTLEAKKSNYSFPATSLKNAPQDELYQDLYYGGDIEVTDSSTINFNIPMDPIAADWNQVKKQQMGLLARFHIPSQLRDGIFWSGFAWSVFMTLLAASPFNLAVAALYLVLIGLRLYRRWQSPWGVIYDSSHRPIAAAAVHLINLENPLAKRPPVVTKSSGRYSFLVDRGRYQLQVAIKKSFGYGAPIQGPIVEVLGRQGSINHDLVVEAGSEKNAAIDIPDLTAPAKDEAGQSHQ